eukprot:TRINITY_DN7821_c0_g1_i3.p1 TRINITY_DN7821_c0_g1~~TRINITY_DN7821_c0_g1_i3.p1  ORF type:complete len:402 (+),score=88.17 TRINITY_DN7821_c0_g1_i3:702-1907(+)
MTTRLGTLLDYLKLHPEFLGNLLNHLNCAAVPDFISRLVGVEAEYEGKGTLQWLVDNKFVEQLIYRFSPEYVNLQSDLARTVVEIVVSSSESSPLVQRFYVQENVELLLSLVLKEGNEHGFRSGLAVVSQLLRGLSLSSSSIPPDGRDIDLIQTERPPPDTPLAMLPPVIRQVMATLPKLNRLLESPPVVKHITNQLGERMEAFGFYRLAIVACIECLLSLGYTSVLTSMMTNHTDLYINLLGLLSRFPTNNFCPLCVHRIFVSTIKQASDRVIVQFVRDCNLPHVLLEKEKEFRSHSSNFLGIPFLHKIGHALCEKQQLVPELEDYLGLLDGWQEYAEALMEEQHRLERRKGPLEPDCDETDENDAATTISDSGDSNDADDYDTSLAEVLLSKAEIEAIF